jgi:hypothetical protein
MSEPRPVMNEHQVHAVIHGIFLRMGYRQPKFSISSVMETMFPEIEVVGREIPGHALIEIYPRPLPSGVRATIVYNERAHASTHRFSIAHELAHYIFDTEMGTAMPSPGDPVCSVGPAGGKSLSERRADYFASELLVPLWILDPMVDFDIHVDKGDPDAVRARDQKIQRLASRFDVSLRCMKFRVFDLAAWRNISHGK